MAQIIKQHLIYQNQFVLMVPYIIYLYFPHFGGILMYDNRHLVLGKIDVKLYSIYVLVSCMDKCFKTIVWIEPVIGVASMTNIKQHLLFKL